MPVLSKPEGYHTVTPFLLVKDTAKLIEFCQRAFGAIELFRMQSPDGIVMHAEIKIGDSILMLSDPGAQYKPMPCWLYLYVDDTDATYKQAIEAGAQSFAPPADQFYGDRNASVVDPFGNHWGIATHIEDVSPEEISIRAANLHK